MTDNYDFQIVGSFYRIEKDLDFVGHWKKDAIVYSCRFCHCLVHEPKRHWRKMHEHLAYSPDYEPTIEGR